MGSQATAPVHDPRDLRRLEPDWFTIDMADGTENLWFYWPMLGTGVIVAITSVVLVGVGGLLGADWGHGKIDRRATASVGFDRGTVARLEVAAYCTTWVVRRRPTPCGTSWIPTRRARNCGGRPGSATSTPTRSRQCWKPPDSDRRRSTGICCPPAEPARGREVLRLVAAGCSNPDVGPQLGISRRTAEHHVQHIHTELGVSTRPAAALFGIEHGLPHFGGVMLDAANLQTSPYVQPPGSPPRRQHVGRCRRGRTGSPSGDSWVTSPTVIGGSSHR
jgi:DNA-binding CsgD family transcriptional regulator